VTGDLAVWFRAQLDADEQVAAVFRNALGEVRRWRVDDIGGKVRQVQPTEFGLSDVIAECSTHLDAEHIARHDPAFTLADITAKRAILDRHSAVESNYADYPVCAECSHLDHEEEPFPCATLCLLAQPYAGRPGWQKEWELL
jgi:hypothetical protein